MRHHRIGIPQHLFFEREKRLVFISLQIWYTRVCTCYVVKKAGLPMTKILISGYYGFHNAGDDAVLYGIYSSLRKLDPTVEVTVLSNSPEETMQLFQIHAVNRWNALDIVKEIRRADLVLLGGGTLLQDRTSPRSPLYYLGIAGLAKGMGKPVFFYGQGYGPIIHPFSKRIIRFLLNRVDAITVRDSLSGEEMRSHGVTKVPIYVTADPALTIDPLEADLEDARRRLTKHQVDPDAPIAYIAIRDWKGEEHFKEELARCGDNLSRLGWQVVFLSMQYPHDHSPSVDVMSKMKNRAVLIDQPLNFKEIMSLIGLGQLMIGMRLHALILAAIMGVPFIALSYDPKIDRFVESVGKSSPVRIENLDGDALMEEVKEILLRLPEERMELKQRIGPITDQAFESARLLYRLLEKKKQEEKR